MPRIIFIEGGISSGKTTLLSYLREKYHVFEEPLDSWLTDYKEGDVNILELFYRNMKKYGFMFEIMSMITRYKQLIEALKTFPANDIVVIERSYMSCRRVFAQNLYNDGLLSDLEWKIYTEAHDMFTELIKVVFGQYDVKTIYLRTTPEECFARKIGRGREEESEVMPEYFQKLHQLHDEWLIGGDSGIDTTDTTTNKVFIINGDKTKEEITENVIKCLSDY